jgi:hypothetical protein
MSEAKELKKAVKKTEITAKPSESPRAGMFEPPKMVRTKNPNIHRFLQGFAEVNTEVVAVVKKPI